MASHDFVEGTPHLGAGQVLTQELDSKNRGDAQLVHLAAWSIHVKQFESQALQIRLSNISPYWLAKVQVASHFLKSVPHSGTGQAGTQDLSV